MLKELRNIKITLNKGYQELNNELLCRAGLFEDYDPETFIRNDKITFARIKMMAETMFNDADITNIYLVQAGFPDETTFLTATLRKIIKTDEAGSAKELARELKKAYEALDGFLHELAFGANVTNDFPDPALLGGDQSSHSRY